MGTGTWDFQGLRRRIGAFVSDPKSVSLCGRLQPIAFASTLCKHPCLDGLSFVVFCQEDEEGAEEEDEEEEAEEEMHEEAESEQEEQEAVLPIEAAEEHAVRLVFVS